MKFTERFLQLPIQVYDKKMKELSGKEECYDSVLRVNPLEIQSYRPSFDEDDQERKEIVFITLKGGDGYLIYLSMEEFEKRVNNFYKINS